MRRIGEKNRLFQESHAINCQEIDELRRICCEESDRARRLRIDEMSLQQERNSTTVSQLLTQIQDLQNKVNSLSDAREFYDPETASNSGATHVPSQPSTTPSPGTMACRGSGLSHDTRNIMGTTGNVFLKPSCSRRTSLCSLRKFKEFGFIFSQRKTWNYMQYNDTGKGKWDENRRIRQYLYRASKVEVEYWIILVELILTVVWLITWHLQFRNCIWENSRTHWNFKAGKSTSRLKCVRNQQILISQCIGSKKLRWQSEWTNSWHRDGFCDEQIFHYYDMLDAMIASALKKLLNTHVYFRKRVSFEEQRSKIRAILTRGTNCLHDLRAFPCHRSLWSSSRTLRFVQFSLAEWWRPTKTSTFDGVKLYYQQAKFPQMWSWKDCASQNCRILFSFSLSWLCTTEKLSETTDKRVFQDWRHQ